jgi:hypothetical protein
METTAPRSTLFGYAAEFETPEALITAARLAREAGYTKMDAFSPMPVEGLSEAIGYRNKQMPFLMLMGGLFGGSLGMFVQWYASAQSYPLNVGGRPYFSWPMFIVPTFEMTILFAALTGVFGMIILNGLPQPYHSIFNTPGFDRASSDRFFLAIESKDPKFESEGTRQFMEGLSAVRVSAVAK